MPVPILTKQIIFGTSPLSFVYVKKRWFRRCTWAQSSVLTLHSHILTVFIVFFIVFIDVFSCPLVYCHQAYVAVENLN